MIQYTAWAADEKGIRKALEICKRKILSKVPPFRKADWGRKYTQVAPDSGGGYNVKVCVPLQEEQPII